jgi:glycosyltransferase involved in cell wall biosynthesis
MTVDERASGAAQAIGVVLHDLSPGGTERIAIRLANRWAELGRSVRLICGSIEGELRPLIGPAVALEPISPSVPRGPGARSRLSLAVGEALLRRPCDLLFLPGNYHWPLAEAVKALPAWLRPCVVAQMSNPLRRAGRSLTRQAIFEAMTRWRMRKVTCALALTAAARIEADEVFRRRMTLALPLPALDDEGVSPIPAPEGPPLVLSIGRLVEQKDFDLAIRAFALVAETDARLVILGEGPQRPQLAALISQLGLDGRVELAGYVEDVRPWLDRARCLLLSSRFEGYGAVVVEALAAGRPVVAAPCGGAVPELLAFPQAGLTAGSREPQALAAALARQLAAPPPDPGYLARLVAGHRIGPIAQAYLDTFDAARCSILARRAPGARAKARHGLVDLLGLPHTSSPGAVPG